MKLTGNVAGSGSERVLCAEEEGSERHVPLSGGASPFPSNLFQREQCGCLG